jgi:hypothetical protein
MQIHGLRCIHVITIANSFQTFIQSRQASSLRGWQSFPFEIGSGGSQILLPKTHIRQLEVCFNKVRWSQGQPLQLRCEFREGFLR